MSIVYVPTKTPYAGPDGLFTEIWLRCFMALASQGAQQPFIFPQEFGATGNGVSDDTVAFTKAIAAASAAGHGTVVIPTGVYILTSELLVSSVTLMGLGWGSVLQARGNAHAGIALITEGVLRNLTLRGTNVANAAAPGVHSGDSTDMVIDGCLIENWGDCGITLGGGSPARNTVRGCTVRNNHNEGIFLALADDTLIDGNVVTGNRFNGIDTNGSRNRIVNNQVSGNGVGNPATDDVAGILVFGLAGVTASDNLVANNVCSGNRGPNIFIGATATGIADGNTVQDNTCLSSGIRDGILLDAGGGELQFSVVLGNVCRANARDGILATGGAFNLIAHNVVNANADTGIEVLESVCSVHSNVAQGNTGDGVAVVATSTDVTVKDNVLSSNGTDYTDAGTDTVAFGNYTGRGIYGTASWTPGTVPAGTSVTVDVTVNGAGLGAAATAAFSLALAAGWVLTAAVTGVNTVRVTLFNATAGALTLGAGTASAFVQYSI